MHGTTPFEGASAATDAVVIGIVRDLTTTGAYKDLRDDKVC
jgi:hypothetical protein